jgi:hypothetical protein
MALMRLGVYSWGTSQVVLLLYFNLSVPKGLSLAPFCSFRSFVYSFNRLV